MEIDLEAPEDEHAILQRWAAMCDLYGACSSSLTVPAVLLSAVSSIANIALSTNREGDGGGGGGGRSQWIVVGFSALALVATTTQTIVQVLGLSDLESRHERAAGQYEKLALEIRMHTCIGSRDGSSYRSLAELVKAVKRRLDELIDTSPTLKRRRRGGGHSDADSF